MQEWRVHFSLRFISSLQNSLPFSVEGGQGEPLSVHSFQPMPMAFFLGAFSQWLSWGISANGFFSWGLSVQSFHGAFSQWVFLRAFSEKLSFLGAFLGFLGCFFRGVACFNILESLPLGHRCYG